MKRYLAYFKCVIRHKWFVLLAAKKVKCSFWLALIHDMSKFLPSEWPAYSEAFYDFKGEKRFINTEEFKVSWNNHQKLNKHHWQYWVLIQENDEIIPLEMPMKYIREMLADWLAVGKSYNNKWPYIKDWEWLEFHLSLMKLHPETIRKINYILRISKNKS